MASLTPYELNFIRKRIINTYKAEVKKIELPPQKKIIEEQQTIRQPVIKTYEKKIMQPVYGISAGVIGLIAGILLFIAELTLGGIVTLILSGVLSYILVTVVKKTVVEEKEEFEEKKIIVKKEVDAEPQYEEKVIPGKYKINKIGKFNLRFQVEEVKANKLLLCHDYPAEQIALKYPVLENAKKIKKDNEKLEKELIDVPYVLGGEKKIVDLPEKTSYGDSVVLRGVEKNLDDYYSLIESEFQKLVKKKITLSVVDDETLRPFLIKNRDKVSDDESHTNIFKGTDGIEMESFAESWLINWKDRQALLNKIRINSLRNEVGSEFFHLGQTTQYAGFNFYCPECNKEIQEEIIKRDYSVQQNEVLDKIYFSKNTKCQYDPDLNIWKCPVCEKDFSRPIPIHKTLDEILLPVYDNLMEENKVEREKNHSGIRKKEIEYKNEMRKEIERIYFDNLTGIFQLQDQMNSMNAEIEGEKDAIKYIKDIASTYRKVQSKVIDNIHQESINTNKRIQEQTRRVIEQIDQFKDKELGNYEKNMDHLSKAKRIDDMRRESLIKDVAFAVRENTEVTKEGFNHTVGAIKENTEVTREGFKETVGAVKENTKATKDGLEKFSKATQKGFEDVGKSLKRGNAIQAAKARKEGIKLNDEPFWRIDKKLKYLGNDITGSITGRGTIRTEEKKLS